MRIVVRIRFTASVRIIDIGCDLMRSRRMICQIQGSVCVASSRNRQRLYRTDFRSEREFREAFKDYIAFYNEKRPHAVLRYRTPNDYEDTFIRKQAAVQKI